MFLVDYQTFIHFLNFSTILNYLYDKVDVKKIKLVS